ncbi:MAG TPA: hypothetical protein VFZ68_07400 [Acidimicrobiales bacterium]
MADRGRVLWAALAALVVSGAVVGAWAAFWPRSFYDGFPGGGRVWVAADGPYNEHLVRDVGDLNLALTAVTVVALVTLARAAIVAAAVGWLAYQVPHLVYHARHLDLYDTTDQVASIASLTLGVALPLLVLALVPRGRRSEAVEPRPRAGAVPGSRTDI